MRIQHTRIRDYDGNKLVKEAYKKHYTDFHISVIGEVINVLPDDTIGIPHQRFILQLPGSDQTILVVHNLDFGKRLHVGEHDIIRVTGEYVWNQHGGLIHLTHYDPYGTFEPGAVKVLKETHANPTPTATA